MKSHRLRPLAVALALFSASARAETIQATGRDLRELLASAPPHAVIQCDPRETLVLTEPLRIGQPLTLIGLHARLPEKLGAIWRRGAPVWRDP